MNKKIYLILLSITLSCISIQKEKEDPYFLYLKYLNSSEKGNFKEAKKYIEKLVKDYKKQEFEKEYILFLYKIKEYEKLKKKFEEHIKNYDIDSSLTYTFLSACAFTKDIKKFEKYEKIFRERFPDNKNLWYLISILYYSLYKFDKSIEISKKLIEIDPENKKTYLLNIIRALESKGDYKSALEEIKKIEKEYENDYDILIEKAIILENIGKLKESLLEYKKAYKLNNRFSLLKKIIDLSILIEDYKGAEKFLDSLIVIRPYDINILNKIGFVKYMLEKYIEAAKYFSLSLSLNPKNDLAHYYLSRIFYRQNLKDEAFNHIEKAIEINPGNEEYLIYQAFLFITENKTKEAEYALRKLRNKKNASYYYLRGFLERRKNNFKRAIKFYLKAIKIDSTDPRKWFELGSAYERIDDVENAEKAFKRAITLDTLMAEAYNYWGYMLAERGLKLDTAKILIEKALKIEPTNGYYLDSMGWVYYMMGDYEKAKVFLRQAASLTPDDPVIIEHLGDVYFKLNQIEKALKYWEEALRLDPKNKKLKEKITKNRGI